jgi:hypothetical protein
VVQRQVLYLGEINDSQQAAWRKTIEVCDEGTKRQVALFPEDALPIGDATVVGVRLSELQLKRPAAVGGVLASLRALAAVGSGHILVSALTRFTQRHPLGAGVANPGGVSADRSGLGMAPASGLVHGERDG